MRRALAGRAPVQAALLFAGAALISGITILDGIQPNDEGLMLQAAARIADGQVPYEDFWVFYPPGQPYLLAGLWEVFGDSLLSWRVLRVLCDAGVAVLVWILAGRAGAPQWVRVAAWLAAALAMAYPSGPHPFPPTLVFALLALLVFERRPALAGALAGLCAVWRLEFAAYLGLGVLLAYAVRPGPRGERARLAGVFAGAAAAVAIVLYAPVVAMAGVGDSFDLLIRFPLTDFGPYQSLPFPFDYDGPLNTSSIGGFIDDSLEPMLLFYLPLVLMAGLVASLAVLALRFGRERWWQLAGAVFAVGMAHYLLVRPDLFHTAPLAVMDAVLIAWALARREWRAPARGGRLALVGAGVAAVAMAYAVAEGLDRRLLELRADTAELRLPAADGVRVDTRMRQPLEDAVNYVRRRVPPGEPIYVATLRADLASSGHPLFYVLADRENPTRYDIQQAGVITTAPVQLEIVEDIERAKPELIVRYLAAVTARREPNEAGKSTGVAILDGYFAGTYREAERFGAFLVLERR
jgi:hypothetical protein